MKHLFWLVIFSLIFIRFQTTKPKYKTGDFVRISSKVYSEPIVYEKEQYVVLQRLKIYFPKYPQITYGDYIVVEGIVDGDKLKKPNLIKVESGKYLFKLRQNLIDFYKSSIPEPYSSLVAGVVIGSKNMPEKFWAVLKSTGTAHVVVASGTNVTMTINFIITFLTYFMNRKKVIWVTLVSILVYVTISGFDAPIVRAALMGSILLVGQLGGRVVDTWRIFLLSASIMLIIKPNWLFDLGFILSFVATTSLLLFQKKIDSFLKFVPNVLREGLSTSIAAQIGVAPIIFATFGQFNLFSPVINVLVLWTVSYIMVFGALAGFIGLVVPILGRLILFALFPFLLWFTKILELFS